MQCVVSTSVSGPRKRRKNNVYDNRDEDIKKLYINEIVDLEPLKLPDEAWRDHKKLTRFLESVEFIVNKMMIGAKEQMRLTAKELVARPSYSEEFANLRDNINETIAIKQAMNQDNVSFTGHDM